MPGECLFPEPPLDVVEDFAVDWVGVIQDILEGEVGGTETVAKVLGEDPAGI